ncbi:MAG: hypothetical protein CVU63_19580 [Deltaproteobacteria bacterium HGW-Deltaproteobacteria-20]|jgi:ribosomal protein L37AE/L43A|nr:MAG: hypothetical protein CVU63_19580 [Deltaproteobacteria bacterium HGW-Deltaproteobacteria-20]
MADLVFYLIALLVGAVVVGIPIYKAMRMRRAESEPLADDVCVACNTKNVAILAPGVYRCNQCGFTGGSGMAEYQQQILRERAAQMTPQQRYQSALQDLRDARLGLLGVEGLLQDAATSSAMDMVGIGGGLERGQAKQTSLGAAIGQMRQAQERIRMASTKLATSHMAPEEIGVDFGSAAFMLGVSFVADSFLVDLAVHMRINKIREQSRNMLAAVESALQRLESLHQAV